MPQGSPVTGKSIGALKFWQSTGATIVAIRNESGGWKWAIFVAVYTTVVAYVMAWATYALGAALF